MRVLLGNGDPSGRRYNQLGLVDLTSIVGARKTLDWSKEHTQASSLELGSLGAYESRLQSNLAVIRTAQVNFSEANSRIMDADVATETAALVATQIKQQVGRAVLAQANQQPQIALDILGAI